MALPLVVSSNLEKYIETLIALIPINVFAGIVKLTIVVEAVVLEALTTLEEASNRELNGPVTEPEKVDVPVKVDELEVNPPPLNVCLPVQLRSTVSSTPVEAITVLVGV